MAENIHDSTEQGHRMRVNMFRQIWIVFSTGALLATLFTAFTPLGLIPLGLGERIAQLFSSEPSNNLAVQFPTPTARPKPTIGIVAGHWGNDPGATCSDGLREVDVNLEIATRVKEILVAEGFDVDVLMEKDDRLNQYRALLLVSIHADSCQFINTESTGFKVASALSSARPDKANRLVACLTSRYQIATNLNFHAGSITSDMTNYHAFDEIHVDTTAAIIETGFLNLDRQLLTQEPERVASGISAGVLCYIRNEDASLPDAAAVEPQD